MRSRERPRRRGGTPARTRQLTADVAHATIRRLATAWHRRAVPPRAWDEDRDPYRVLVREVMSQQTQISRVIEHHARFLERFPTVHALAAASPGAVIAAWSGLGYNRRARNLHAAANAIVVEHGGAVPSDVTALVRLPGIGPYTAAAIAVYAFGAREPVVDTNIRRLVGRAVLGRSDATDREVRPAVAELLAGRIAPARLIQALMDLGSLVCLPRNPSCATCPLLTVCRAARTGPVPDVPRKAQGRFEGSTRQARGAALRAIGARPQGLATSSVDPTILEGLLRDGLVERSGRRVRLPR